jgi:MFS family permease
MRDVIVIAVLFIFYGLYQGIFRAVGKAFATDFVPEHLRASGIGWYNTMVGLAGLVASIVAGLLWAFAGAGCIALAVLIPARRV